MIFSLCTISILQTFVRVLHQNKNKNSFIAAVYCNKMCCLRGIESGMSAWELEPQTTISAERIFNQLHQGRHVKHYSCIISMEVPSHFHTFCTINPQVDAILQHSYNVRVSRYERWQGSHFIVIKSRLFYALLRSKTTRFLKTTNVSTVKNVSCIIFIRPVLNYNSTSQSANANYFQ